MADVFIGMGAVDGGCEQRVAFFRVVMTEPAERGTIESWASRVGVSQRTLARLLTQETGMSFGRWRQQLHLMLAVKWLGTGHTVQQVADELGYESAGRSANLKHIRRPAFGSVQLTISYPAHAISNNPLLLVKESVIRPCFNGFIT